MNEFEQIYIKYFSRLYAFIYKMCRNDSICEEMTQESFYQAFISFSRYDGSCDIFTWLAAIAKNTYFKYLRKRKDAPLDIDLLLDKEPCADDSDPQDSVARKQENERVREIINGLPSRYRDVVILRIYAELPFAKIAAEQRISEDSAKVIFCRAKKMIKEKLNNERL